MKHREHFVQRRQIAGGHRRPDAARRHSALMRKGNAFPLLLAATALTMPMSALAQDTMWTGGDSDDWFDPGNWSGGVPMVSTDTYINGDGMAPVIDGNDAVTRDLIMGTGDPGAPSGSLAIENGGRLESNAAAIGIAAGSDYSVTVSGPNASWTWVITNSNTVWAGKTTIGEAGIGRLNILDGADVVGDRARIGGAVGGEGHVLVEGIGSTWTLTSSLDGLHVGFNGDGELVVSNGGVVTTEYGGIGFEDTSTGTVTVTGDGSALNAALLIVGTDGEGQLSILDGGKVEADSVRLGDSDGGTGTVIVSGANSTLNVSQALRVGNFGVASDQSTGVLTIAEGGTVTVNGGTGTVFVGGLHSYGTFNIGADTSDSAVAPGSLNAAKVDLGGIGIIGKLNFNHTGTAYEFSAQVTGASPDSVIENRAGTTILTGDSPSFLGHVYVSGGKLLVNQNLGPVADFVSKIPVDVYGGGTLGGIGKIHGNVLVDDGIVAPGASVGTLRLGSLALSASSALDFELGDPAGAPGADSDLLEVDNDLTLDGTLNVIDAGGFGDGTYRLIDYGGVLTDNGLDIGSVPEGFAASDFTVLTDTDGQVDLLVGGSSTSFAFWDGSNTAPNDVVDGGAGTWTATATNWTNNSGGANGAYDPSDFLIFRGTGGDVLVDNSAGAITIANGMQFAVDDYAITGDSVTLSGATTIRVGDGTSAGADFTATIASSLAGSGSLEKTDLGTLVLDASDNSYTGGTIVTDGTLIGNAESLQGDILNNAGLVFDQENADGSFSGVLTGTGETIKEGGATLLLTGDSSAYAGTMDVRAGTLSVSASLGGIISVASGAALSGSGTVGAVSVDDGGTLAPGSSPGTLTILGDLVLSPASILDFELGDPAGAPGVNSDLIEVGGDLTLDGALNIADVGGFGAGTYRLINYAGALTDNGLIVGSLPAGFSASDLSVLTETQGQVDLLVGGSPASFAFWDGSNTTPNDAIDGGAGTWTATATNWTDSSGAANGAYDPSAFLIFQGDGGAVLVDNSAGPVTVANGLQFAVSDYSIDGDDIRLSGAVTIRVGDGTSASSSHVASIGADLVGSGSLEKDDLGTLILSGTNSYSGGTIVRSGTLIGNTDSLQGDILNEAALVFEQEEADGTYAGALTGAGATAKQGDFALTLTGDSSAYAGTTEIVAGTLLLDGELGGALAVRNGARLGGDGSAGAVTVNDGGTLAPGNSIGTLNVASATFDAGSLYEVELNGGGTTAGTNNDLLAASGAVTINGGTVHVTPENGTDDGTSYAIGAQYTIITTEDGVSGTFTSLTDDYPYLDFTLSYDAGNVYLLSELAMTTFCLDGMTTNQCTTGDGAFSLGLGDLFTAVLNLPESAAPGALDQLSGEIHASAKAALIEDSRFPREAALDRMRSAFGSVGAGGNGVATRSTEAFAVWGQAYGAWANWDGKRNTHEFERSVGGLFLGVDAPLADNLRLGLFGGYGKSSIEANDLHSSGSDKAVHLGAYLGAELGHVGLRIGGAYTWHDIDIDRSMSFAGFSDSLSSSYKARTLQIFGEAGYRFDIGAARLEPFANIAHVDLDTDGYAETGGTSALHASGQGMAVTYTTAGLRADTAIGLGGTYARLVGMAGWRHAFGDVFPSASHAFAGGDAFTVAGVPIARNAFVMDAGAELMLARNAMLGISYGGQFGSRLIDHSLKANLIVRF